MAHSTYLRALTLTVALVLLLISVDLVTASKVDSCKPDCTGHNPGDMVADPTNCRQFYFCVSDGPTSEAFACGDGMVFNGTVNDCVVGDTCSNQCSSCSYVCAGGPDEPTYVADQYDCTVYYGCDASQTKHSCPADNQFFDGSVCQPDETKCCSCKPFCSDTDLLKNVIDPTNCKRYFFCDKLGVPEYSTECPSGNFDITTGKCSDTAPCITLCTNVVGLDGCIDIYTCEVLGNHAKCKQRCDPHYYHCSSSNLGQVVTASSCTSGLYYHPDKAMCVTRDNCPYPDPGE